MSDFTITCLKQERISVNFADFNVSSVVIGAAVFLNIDVSGSFLNARRFVATTGETFTGIDGVAPLWNYFHTKFNENPSGSLTILRCLWF